LNLAIKEKDSPISEKLVSLQSIFRRRLQRFSFFEKKVLPQAEKPYTKHWVGWEMYVIKTMGHYFLIFLMKNTGFRRLYHYDGAVRPSFFDFFLD
jgi:hypothetical protein